MDKDILSPAIDIFRRSAVSVIDYARTVELPDGDFAGTHYDPTRHQAQHTILRAIDSGARWVAICKPVQDGGSLAAFIPLLRRAHAMGQTVIVAYPTMDLAKDAWVKKVWPMLERQGGVTPKNGGGSRGGAARVVQLPQGGSIILRAAGGRQESGQASVSADAMLVDEVDDWADMRVLRLIERRLSRSRDPLIIYVSTVKRDELEGVDRSRILRLYEQGTMTRLHYPCAKCGALFAFEWEQVDQDACVMRCPHCSAALDDADRIKMLPHAKRYDQNQTKKFSIMWTALESPFPMLVDGQKLPVIRALCLEHKIGMEAAEKGDHGLLRQFFRDRLCRTYHDEENEVPHTTEIALASRSASAGLRRGDIPESCECLAIGADVGKRDCWWAAVAIDRDQRWWVVDWGRSEIDGRSSEGRADEPSPQERAAMLDRMYERTLRLRRCDVACIDCGYTPELVVPWARKRKWRLVRGDQRPEGTDAVAIGQWGEARKQKAGHTINFIRTDEVKKLMHSCLAIDPGKPGAGMIPRGEAANDWIIRHLCSETWSTRDGWVKIRPQNHLLDCVVYALAFCLAHKRKAEQAQRRYGIASGPTTGQGPGEISAETGSKPRARQYGIVGHYV
jgi:phage terminase large subunit GpA-like protein